MGRVGSARPVTTPGRAAQPPRGSVRISRGRAAPRRAGQRAATDGLLRGAYANRGPLGTAKRPTPRGKPSNPDSRCGSPRLSDKDSRALLIHGCATRARRRGCGPGLLDKCTLCSDPRRSERSDRLATFMRYFPFFLHKSIYKKAVLFLSYLYEPSHDLSKQS